MGSLILDASVLIGLLDDADAHHQRAVDDVEAADEASTELVAPASAYGEAMVAFARVERIGDAREAIAAMGIRVSPLDARTAERTAELWARHPRLRLHDAIVLATAHELGGGFLSYDERLARYASIDDR